MSKHMTAGVEIGKGYLIKTHTRKTEHGFRGYISCYLGKSRIWTETDGVDWVERKAAQDYADKTVFDHLYKYSE